MRSPLDLKFHVRMEENYSLWFSLSPEINSDFEILNLISGSLSLKLQRCKAGQAGMRAFPFLTSGFKFEASSIGRTTLRIPILLDAN